MTEEVFAAIDLGSNSFRILVANYQQGKFEKVAKFRERVQMARGLDSQGEIKPAYWHKGIASIFQFAEILKKYRPRYVRAVATNVFRKAQNAKAWIQEASKILEYPIEIISGEEEANLIYLGISRSILVPYQQLMVVDIGGGSTEVVIGTAESPLIAKSCDMGCISYQQRFFVGTEILENQFTQAIRAAKQELAKSISLNDPRVWWNLCLGSSGTVSTCYELLQRLDISSDEIKLSDLRRVQEKLLQLKYIKKFSQLGLSVDRKDIFASGLAILIAIFEYFSLETLQYSKAAIREGILWDFISKNPA